MDMTKLSEDQLLKQVQRSTLWTMEKPTQDHQAGLVIPLINIGDQTHLIFTKRSASMRSHPGQISFPGGKREDIDGSMEDCARREWLEEMGTKLSSPLVTYHELRSPHGLHVQCFCSHLSSVDQFPNFDVCPDEVDYAFSLSIADLISRQSIRWVKHEKFGPMIEFRIEGERIWGFTGFLVRQLCMDLFGYELRYREEDSTILNES